MRDLSVDRVFPSRPFTNTGIDFCGSIYVRDGKMRGTKRVKAYIAVFICTVVKVIHL